MKKSESTKPNEKDVIIYRGPKGNVSLRAQFEKETMWATQEQMAVLFGTMRPAITKHINNIFKDNELSERSVCSILEHTARDGKNYKVKYYNLDMIIAVGYRVNSKQATSFRIWATETLRDFILRGYVLNRQRILESKQNTLKDLENAISLIQNISSRKYLEQDEMSSLLSVIKDYTSSFEILNDYDSSELVISSSKKNPVQFSYSEVLEKVNFLKDSLMKAGEASDLFAIDRNNGMESIVNNIHQSISGKAVYPSIEERAAHLLYFVIKDHPLVDGNKRVGAFLFILFLRKNKVLVRKNGERKINDNTLTSLALLIAQSDPKEKEQMIALITQLIK